MAADRQADMSETIQRTLGSDRVVDITTRGRSSGEARRIEIWFWRVAGRLYLTGAPGAERHWFRNLQAEPGFTVHVKQSAQGDLAAEAIALVEIRLAENAYEPSVT